MSVWLALKLRLGGLRTSNDTRKFLPVLFLTLQEDKGVFGPIVKRTMFKARNLHVTASTSGKMTKQLLIEWCEKVFFPHMYHHCIFLADSWTTFADQEAVEEVEPEELEYEMITIPLKVNGQIQPLDVLPVGGPVDLPETDKFQRVLATRGIQLIAFNANADGAPMNDGPLYPKRAA
ncbi:hypothetical protein RvY_19163 [Ramazzottius varieornatus]|uniref:DDE-1 domain-containing protein n=1 Tax=Ramazzottius varieornatus TaxID=947166 RepID=A0A1D1W8F8_RAMVA|nr:hypothetical protein RvY_19163 [Ramazzottius varieornatus]